MLEKYVTPAAVKDLLDDKGADLNRMRSAKIEFIFLLLNDIQSPEILSGQIAEITSMGCQHNATTDVICGPLLVLDFNVPTAQPDATAKRTALADQLRLHFGTNIKIIHGSADGHVGLFGSSTRLSYSFTFPGFANAVNQLGRLSPGEMKEFKS